MAGVVLAGLEGVAGAADPGTPDLPGEPLIPRFAASEVRLLGVDRVALFPDGPSAADPVEEMVVVKTGGAGDLRLVDGFARWVTAGRPAAGGAELALRRNRGPLSSLGPMPINLQTGAINGTPLDLATASWSILYPAWDHTNARVSPTDAFDPGYGYTQFGNDLAYHPSTRDAVSLRAARNDHAAALVAVAVDGRHRPAPGRQLELRGVCR
jgi:hypothetical protein